MNISYCLGLAATVAIWVGPKPAVGYLARVGPAPLRFQPPPKGLSELGPLPPLAMTNQDPPFEVLGPPPPAEPAPVVETNAPAQPAPGPVVPLEPVITPQMFLQFFSDRNGTNRDFNVVVPYQFMPPPATTIPAPPSRAIYNLK
jgi:hypothetical protein